MYEETDTKKANKDHTCCNCRAEIKKGSSYCKVAGKWDGEFKVFKQCLSCIQVVRNGYKMYDDWNHLTEEDMPGLDLGGVSEFLQRFLCTGYNGEEAAQDMAKTLELPIEYVRERLSLNK